MKYGYSMPTVSSFYSPPPYAYKDNNSINIVFRTTAEILRDLLPPPLLPNPENLAFFYAGEFSVEAPVKVKYKEAGIGIPVLYEEKPGNYFVYLYLDLAAAIVPGREIWGWPKKDAEISYSSEKSIIQTSVKRDGIEIIRASVNASEQVKPIPDLENIPALNLKIIPSVIKNHPPDVLQLTSAGGSSTRKELFRGEAALSFASGPNDLLGMIPVLEILNGERYVEDMSLDCGDVLIDYLAENQY